MISKSMNKELNSCDCFDPDFPFYCVEEEDGSFTFYWDENHPITSVFNTWTEDEFINAILTQANKVIESQAK